MAKLIGTADEIRDEIQRRIRESDELNGDCRGCGAPTPYRIDPATNDGCNWMVDVFPSVEPGCLEFVKAITHQVMHEYDLA